MAVSGVSRRRAMAVWFESHLRARVTSQWLGTNHDDLQCHRTQHLRSMLSLALVCYTCNFYRQVLESPRGESCTQEQRALEMKWHLRIA